MTGAVLEGAMGPQSQKINKVELKKVYIKGLVIVKVWLSTVVCNNTILTPLSRQVTKGKARQGPRRARRRRQRGGGGARLARRRGQHQHRRRAGRARQQVVIMVSWGRAGQLLMLFGKAS